MFFSIKTNMYTCQTNWSKCVDHEDVGEVL